MTTRTMRLASGFLDSLSASEYRRSTFADRSRRSCIHLYVLVLWRIGSEFRAYVRTLCAQLAQTCADNYYARSAIPRQNNILCANNVEDRLGIPRICAHSMRTAVRTLCAQLAQTCADIMHVAQFRDKIYLHYTGYLDPSRFGSLMTSPTV